MKRLIYPIPTKYHEPPLLALIDVDEKTRHLADIQYPLGEPDFTSIEQRTQFASEMAVAIGLSLHMGLGAEEGSPLYRQIEQMTAQNKWRDFLDSRPDQLPAMVASGTDMRSIPIGVDHRYQPKQSEFEKAEMDAKLDAMNVIKYLENGLNKKH